MSLPQNETRNTTTKRQIIKDPGVEAAFPGVDDGTTPGDPFAPADVGGEKPGAGAGAGEADNPQLEREGVESLQAAGRVRALVVLMGKPS